MKSPIHYQFTADIILVVHLLFVMFVVGGFLLIVAGKWLRYTWVRNPWFRWAHLGVIGVVVLQSWFGMICPLTTWEMALRSKAGDVVYGGSFISHWLQTILYYSAPDWVFALCYTLFGTMVVASWFWVKPRSFRKGK